MGAFLAEPKNQDQASYKAKSHINTFSNQADMLAGLAQLEFDILGLDAWWIGLTDQGHEGRYF